MVVRQRLGGHRAGWGPEVRFVVSCSSLVFMWLTQLAVLIFHFPDFSSNKYTLGCSFQRGVGQWLGGWQRLAQLGGLWARGKGLSSERLGRRGRGKAEE